VACLAHWPNHNFPQYFIKGMILGKISYWTQCVYLDFPYNLCVEDF
jgi:hypothetical protein